MKIKCNLMKAISAVLMICLIVASMGFCTVSGAAKKVSLKDKKLNLFVGNTLYIDFVTEDKELYYNLYNYSTYDSSNPEVASVDGVGLITANKAGAAIITAKYDGQNYTCEVKVKDSKYQWDKKQ